MTAGPLEVYWVELLLFYVFALGILFLPLRWSVLCLLLAGCVEVIPPGFVSATSVSWQNAAERIILPTILFLRLTRFRIPRIRWSFPSKAWAALVVYAAISLLWSPFKLPGLKMVVYLAAWFVLYLVFYLAWRCRLLDQRIIITAIWGGLGLACLQSYVMGNPLFGMQNRLGEFASAQFSPFTGPQSFGPFLACLLALLLFSNERLALRFATICACLLALVLVGSRYSLIEGAIVVCAWCAMQVRIFRNTGRIRFVRAAGLLLLSVAVLLAFRGLMAGVMPTSRVNQLLNLDTTPDVVETGTFGWRLERYQLALTKLSGRSFRGLVFGSGTSSGAEVAMDDQMTFLEDVDPNRAIHDEFLRAEYEWGFLGLGLGIAMSFYAARQLWTRAFRYQSLASLAALSIMPGVLLALLIENPLAGPGTAESFGYLLVLTYGFTFGRPGHANSDRDAGIASVNIAG